VLLQHGAVLGALQELLEALLLRRQMGRLSTPQQRLCGKGNSAALQAGWRTMLSDG